MNDSEALPFQIRRIGGSYVIEDTRPAKTQKLWFQGCWKTSVGDGAAPQSLASKNRERGKL